MIVFIRKVALELAGKCDIADFDSQVHYYTFNPLCVGMSQFHYLIS
jgi:hypothetical protein